MPLSEVFLIDFDRARLMRNTEVNGKSNLARLKRSLQKLWPAGQRASLQPGRWYDLGVSLALFALMSLLAWARVGGNSEDFIHLLGRLLYWAAGVAAFVGGWQVFRTRED